jgi:hypothetical protein
MDVRFGIWNVTYCYTPGSLKTAAAELTKYSGQQIKRGESGEARRREKRNTFSTVTLK